MLKNKNKGFTHGKDGELIIRGYDWQYETREEDGVGIIEGHPVVIGQRTDMYWFDEIIEPGALDSTDMKDVRLCLNHDTSVVYARSRNNSPGSTMTIWTEADGLHFRANLDLENPLAKAYYSMIDRRDIDKMSFMFSVDKDQWDDIDTDHPLRHILSIRSIVEISAVTFPAYDSTDIQARDKEALESARQQLESERQSRAESPEGEETRSDGEDIELAKAKFNFSKIYGGNKS